MSMHNYANWGYVCKAKELVPLLSREKETEYLKLLEGEFVTAEDIKDFLDKTLTEDIVPEIFCLNDECESDDLEIGEFYACFDECDLFQKVRTPLCERLNSIGIGPQEARWVTFG
jgi:hypothetical protein